VDESAPLKFVICRKSGKKSLKTHEGLFLEVISLWEKIAQKFVGKVWETSGKYPSHPKKFACSYTYEQRYK